MGRTAFFSGDHPVPHLTQRGDRVWFLASDVRNHRRKIKRQGDVVYAGRVRSISRNLVRVAMNSGRVVTLSPGDLRRRRFQVEVNDE